MTADKMRGQLRVGTRDPSGSEYTDAALLDILNQGVRDVVLKTTCYTGRWTRETVVGTESYAFPTDCVRIMAVSYETYRLGWTSDIHANVNSDNQQGTPQAYYVSARSYSLIPIPGAVGTLTIDGVKFPDDMTEGAECPLPVEMHQLPILFGLYQLSYFYDPPNVDRAMARYLGELKRVQSDMRPPTLDEFPRINYVPGGVRATYFKGTSIRVDEPD